MAENCTRKLIVEICNAKNLMPKDGQGTASAYAIVDFDGQRRRTKTKLRDLNPVWDEKLEFLVHEIESMATEILEINLYNDKKTGKRSTFLGKVKLAGSVFVKAGDESLVYYPLEKRSVFSQIKGEIGVKVFYVDEETPPVAAEAAAEEKAGAAGEKPLENPKPEEDKKEEKVEEKKEEEEKPKEESPKEEEKPNPPPAENSNPQDAAPAATPATTAPSAEVENPPLAHKEPIKAAKDKAETGKSTELVINELELRSLSGDRSHAYDLVDRMPFLYVRVVKAKRANKEPACPAYAKLVIGTHSIKTKSQIDKDWDQVFSFDKDGLNSSSLEVSVWTEEEKKEEEKEGATSLVENCLGTVSFDLQEVPKRVPPDSPLAPQWYSLESEKSPGNDVMVAVWVGTQADEAFQEAWQSDSGGLIPETRAKVYLSPMGEIEIAVRFSCSSWLSLIQAYGSPLLPRMHYIRPLGPAQQDILRHTAMRIVTARLARSEPPLGQEVVQFMLDSDTHVWSMRRSKANWFRVVGCLSHAATLARWLDGIRTWAHPPTTVLLHVLLLAVVLCPHLVLPTVFMYAFLILALRFRYRLRVPNNMDPRLSYVDAVGPDELDEEFDGLPTTRSPDTIRIRYDRLRALAGRAQTLLGDVAAQGERLEALFNWRDPRATGMFVVFCLFASLLFYVVPFKVFVLGSGFYYIRHPRFRDDMPSVPLNFFRRLPSLSDQIM
ncbi:protein QUIRKY [Herrania umbratica]|uniref:Protein QUIRKY n=1 Tax=Herrania umbratica TaxID=108875 RepID=A0A6J1A5H6_9ROSI|nr:protein QUIRKY [Herrania umbratica]